MRSKLYLMRSHHTFKVLTAMGGGGGRIDLIWQEMQRKVVFSYPYLIDGWFYTMYL